MKQKKYSGYFCKKCNMIPYIQIIIEKKNINILSLCRCIKKYQNIDSFIKNEYKTNIVDLNEIENNSLINKNKEYKDDKIIDIQSIINKYNNIKEKLYKDGIYLKNKLIGMYKEKIEKIEEFYENFIRKNKKISIILENIIKSYKLINNNQSNIFNIINNCNFNEKDETKFLINNNNLEILSKEVEKFFNEKYIISNSFPLKEPKNNKFIIYQYMPIKMFIEIDNSICASISNNSNNLMLKCKMYYKIKK